MTDAIIFVDGKEFIREEDDNEARKTFRKVVDEIGGEVALMVWKPKYGIYLREQLSISAPR